MAPRIRAFGWASTPLGPITGWPQSLKTIVDLMLNTPQPATVAVGPDRIFLYNDEAAQLYGSRHPEVLGRPLAEAFEHEFDQVAEFYDRVFAGESVHVPAQVLDPARSGASEVFDACLTPVHAADGAVIAAYVTVAPSGRRLRAETALRESEQRFRAFVTATSDVVYRMSPDWSEMRQLDGRGFLSDTAEPTGSWMDGYIPSEDQPAVREAIERAILTGRPFELEHKVIRTDGTAGWTASRAVPIRGADGQITEWMGAAADVTARRQTGQALREREEEYRTLFEAIDQGFCTIELRFDEQGRAEDYVFLATNQAFLEQAGFGDENIVGKTMRSFAPEHEQSWFDTYARVARTGRPERFEHEASALGKWYNVYAFRPKTGARDQVAVLFEDITTRKSIDAELRESEERQAFLLKLSDTLRPLADPAEIQDAATRVLGEHLGANRVAYVQVTDDEYIIEQDYVDGVPSMAGRFRVNSFGTDKVGDYQEGRTRVVRDTEKDARNDPVATSNFAAFGVAAGIGVPLIKGGRFVGTLVVHMSEPRDWSPGEVALAEETAERTWAAIERAQAEAALRESEARLAAAFESVPAGIAVNDTTGAIVIANSLYRGFLPKGVLPSRDSQRAEIWRSWDEQGRAIDPHDFPSARALRGETVVPGQEMLLRDDDGREVWTQVAAVPVRDTNRRITGIATVISDIDARKRAETALRDSEQALAADLAGASLLRGLSERLGTEEDLATIHEEILSAAIAITQADAGTIQIYEPDSCSLILLVTRGFDRGMTDHFHRVDADSETACGGALREGRRTFIGFDEDETDEAYRMHVAAGYNSAQATPLLSRAGAPLGMLNTHWRAPRHRSSERELRYLDLLARQAADLIERAQAQQRLRDSEELLRQFGDASQDILWIRDAADLQWVYLTPAFEAIYGLGREEALSGDSYRNWTDMIVSEDRGHALASIERVRAGESVSFEFRIRRPNDGTIRWLRNTDFPITDDNGQVTLIGGIGHDFTEVREAEVRLQTLMEGIPQLVWRAVDHGEWTWAGPQWTAYTGRTSEESQGWGWLEVLHPDDREKARAAWSHAVERGGFETEYRLRKREDGSYRWFRTRATPVRDEAGEITDWLGTSTDVEDLRALQDRQRVLLHELQHRVRNTLAIVRSLSKSTAQSSETVEDFAAHFEGRLNALARTQMVLTRSAGAGVDLESLVREELLAQAPRPEQVQVEGPDIMLSAKAAEVLALAVHELATNAVKYGALSERDGVVTVRWSTREDAGELWLELEWAETGVSVASTAPQREGFGTELVTMRVPYELQGRGRLDLKLTGLQAQIAFPLRPGQSVLQTNAPGE